MFVLFTRSCESTNVFCVTSRSLNAAISTNIFELFTNGLADSASLGSAFGTGEVGGGDVVGSATVTATTCGAGRCATGAPQASQNLA